MGDRQLNGRRDRRRRRRLALGLSIAALGVSGAAVGVSLAARAPATAAEPIVVAPKTAAVRESGQKAAAAPTRRHAPIPVGISIPTIGVDARVIRLGLNRDRTIQVPKDFGDTGWFRPGPEPGETGAAVIVGHVASRSGPAVFYRLRELRVGQAITIRLQDGSTVRYVARSMTRVPKNRFPTSRVYTQTKQPTLRLITCAGKLNPATGQHPDNYIVFASIVR